jgi:hypothetical protein
MDAGMKRRATARAAQLGVSLAEYVRRIVANDLGEHRRAADISEVFDLVGDGPETDIARNKHAMISEAVLAEHGRRTRDAGAGKTASSRRRRQD